MLLAITRRRCRLVATIVAAYITLYALSYIIHQLQMTRRLRALLLSARYAPLRRAFACRRRDAATPAAAFSFSPLSFRLMMATVSHGHTTSRQPSCFSLEERYACRHSDAAAYFHASCRPCHGAARRAPLFHAAMPSSAFFDFRFISLIISPRLLRFFAHFFLLPPLR